MSEPDETETETESVLSGLPSTRPQRRSPKRGPTAHSGSTLGPAAGGQTPGRAGTDGAPRRRRAAAAGPGGNARATTGAPSPAKSGGRRRPAAAAPPGAGTSQPSPTLGGGVRREGRQVAAQGYEPDTAHGAVEPPSRVDLLGSVAGGAGDLAHVGLTLGRQILRSVLGRLPGT